MNNDVRRSIYLNLRQLLPFESSLRIATVINDMPDDSYSRILALLQQQNPVAEIDRSGHLTLTVNHNVLRHVTGSYNIVPEQIVTDKKGDILILPLQ